MSESDYKLKVGLEVDGQIDENKVKKELEKTGEQAGENLAKGLEKKKDSFLDKIRKFGQAGKKELDKDLVADLKLNKVHLQHQLDELNRQLKQAKKTNQNELEYEIRLKIDETKDKLNQTTSALNGLGKSGKSVGETLVGLAGKLGVWFGIAQVIQFVIKTFNEFQESQKILVQATGASGKALKELSDSVLHLQSSVNQSQNEIASAVGEVNTRLGLTGEELEKTTENYLKFATVTGQEGKQAIADNIRLFNIWGVSTQDQAFYLDQLTLAGQATGVDIGNLTKNLTDNQLALEQMGFGLTESIALLSNFEKQGVNAEQALTLERNKYLKERKVLLESDLDAIAKKHKSLDDKKEQHLRRLQESDLFKKYQSQQREIAENLERINQLERELAIHHLIEEYSKKRNKIEEEIKELISEIKLQNSYTNYPELFTKISNLLKDTYSEVYDQTEKALIYLNTNHSGNPDFENKITDQKDNPLATDDGYTAKRILCALFILSIMAIYSEEGFNFFKFAYYDGVLESAGEGVKRNFIRETKELCNKYNIQYLISVIRTDLPTDKSITNQDIVITLSKNKKLFGKNF